LGLVLSFICGHLRCGHAGFYQHSIDGHYLSLVSGRGKTLAEEDSNINGGIVGRVDTLNTPIWVNVTGLGEPDLQDALVAQGLGSVMCAPISRLKVHGVLYAGQKTNAPAFREVEWEMFLPTGQAGNGGYGQCASLRGTSRVHAVGGGISTGADPSRKNGSRGKTNCIDCP
jgi:hypothetical protein